MSKIPVVCSSIPKASFIALKITIQILNLSQKKIRRYSPGFQKDFFRLFSCAYSIFFNFTTLTIKIK